MYSQDILNKDFYNTCGLVPEWFDNNIYILNNKKLAILYMHRYII